MPQIQMHVCTDQISRSVEHFGSIFVAGGVSDVFGNAEKLFEFNSQFLRNLKVECQNKCHIGATFKGAGQLLEIYSVYVKNYSKALKRLVPEDISRFSSLFDCRGVGNLSGYRSSVVVSETTLSFFRSSYALVVFALHKDCCVALYRRIVKKNSNDELLPVGVSTVVHREVVTS